MRSCEVWIVALSLVCAYVAWSAPPACHSVCDDPVAHAVCKPTCQVPQCIVNCTTNSSSIRPAADIVCGAPHCWTDCSGADPDLSTCACPTCTTQCDPLKCVYKGTLNRTAAEFCAIECEEVQCGWHCDLPEVYTKPACELQCELPACAADLPSPVPSPTAGLGLRQFKRSSQC